MIFFAFLSCKQVWGVMVVKSKGISPKCPDHSGLVICRDDFSKKITTPPEFFHHRFPKIVKFSSSREVLSMENLSVVKSGFIQIQALVRWLELVEITSRKTNEWQWKLNHLKMYLLWNMVIFHCHVSCQGIAILFNHFTESCSSRPTPSRSNTEERWHPSWLRGASPSCLRGWVDFHVQSWTIWGSQQLVLSEV